MKRLECEREPETLREVLAGRWPDHCDEQLRSHAKTCGVCSEVVIVAALLHDQRDEALREAQVPAAGQIWWRTALRAHAEGAAAARRPIVWLQGVAGACAVGLLAGLLGLAWPSIRDAAAWMFVFGSELGPEMAPLVEALRPGVMFALAGIAFLVLMPLAVYFALSDD